jgi:G3E family GTPase
MIQIDLITGFLGAGKTTFLRKYVKYYTDQGLRVGILENDFGAVNVDMLLLQDLRSENCEIEMVIGGDRDCHYRRLKTKLISMSMTGYDRIIMEPSGIFDMDEFYDVLREEPLERWYDIGNIIAVMDAKMSQHLSKAGEYVMASQLANAGAIIFSKMDLATPDDVNRSYEFLDRVTEEYNTRRPLRNLVMAKNMDDYDRGDFHIISQAGYQLSNYVKKVLLAEKAYMTVYLLNHGLTGEVIQDRVSGLFADDSFGEIYRVKGFYGDDESGWYQLNATSEEIEVAPINVGQEVIIVIGNDLKEDKIKAYIGMERS